jgi:Ca2+-transporting ATPase
MITGDNALTARAVAAEIGIMEPGDEVVTGAELEKLPDAELKRRIRSLRVFARVWPEQKLKIVRALQESGEVTAMTGDGVNDAPALKKADIGVAMGITGTEVAKETSDVVLTDDNFATIVHAIKEGRVIFDNIRKFIMYLLACNVGEIFCIFVPILAGLHSPLRPVQILLVNLVTDGLVALSLGVDAPEPGIMKRRPRRVRTGVLSNRDIIFIMYNAAFITLAVMLAYLVGMRMGGRETGMTMAFVTLCLDEIWRAYSFRSASRSFWQINPFTNLFLIGACFSSIAIVLAVVLVEPLQRVFGCAPLSLKEWGFALLFSFVTFVAVECWKVARRIVRARRSRAVAHHAGA